MCVRINKNAGFPVGIVGRAIAYIIPFLYANTVSRSFRGLHEVRISDSPSHLNSRHSGPMFREISRFNPSYFADKSSYFFPVCVAHTIAKTFQIHRIDILICCVPCILEI